MSCLHVDSTHSTLGHRLVGIVTESFGIDDEAAYGVDHAVDTVSVDVEEFVRESVGDQDKLAVEVGVGDNVLGAYGGGDEGASVREVDDDVHSYPRVLIRSYITRIFLVNGSVLLYMLKPFVNSA